MKVYDGLTEYVASAEEAERIRRTLYRTDASARATVLPAYRERLEAADLARFRDQGYLAMEGVLTPDEVAALRGGARRSRAPAARRAWASRTSPTTSEDGERPKAVEPELRVRKLWKFAGRRPDARGGGGARLG